MTSTHPPGHRPADPAADGLRGEVRPSVPASFLEPPNEPWSLRALRAEAEARQLRERLRAKDALLERIQQDHHELRMELEELDGPPVYDVEGVHPSAVSAVETTSLLSRVAAVIVVMSLVAGALALGGAR